MSEFTDYMVFLTAAETLGVLERELVGSVGSAVVPLFELPEPPETRDAAEAMWSALPKPMWVILGTDGEIEQLGRVGTAFHLLVEEDFQSWSIVLVCGGARWNFGFLESDQVYREATAQYADTVLWDPAAHSDEIAKMAACLNLAPEALETTFIADGGQSFSALVGASYQQMEDLSYPGLARGTVTFGYLD